MNNAINELVRSIVKKNSLAECSVSELQRLTTQYPYFGPVQFLLARKLKEENSSQYAKQSQKAILYFQDDLWFDYVTSSRINEAVFSNGNDPAEVLTEINKPVIAEQVQTDQPIEPLLGTTETVQAWSAPAETVAEPVEEIAEDAKENITDREIHTEKEIVDQPEEKLPEPVIERAEEISAPPEEKIEQTAETIELPDEKIEQTAETIEVPEEKIEQTAETTEPHDEKIEQTAETIEVPEAIIEPAQPLVHEKAPVEYDDGISSSVPQPEKEINEPAHSQPVEPMGSEDLNGEEDDAVETTANTDLPPLPGLKIEPFNPETAKLSFEPYHMVDYFASQGIRFKEDEKPKDRFGQQLKSFTEWLKTLKKVPETGGQVTATGPEDKNVTKMAEHSLADGEVVTEAMADVWEKQGKHEKAIETYRKLSLLNPSKSAYFAAKIDHLKHV